MIGNSDTQRNRQREVSADIRFVTVQPRSFSELQLLFVDGCAEVGDEVCVGHVHDPEMKKTIFDKTLEAGTVGTPGDGEIPVILQPQNHQELGFHV